MSCSRLAAKLRRDARDGAAHLPGDRECLAEVIEALSFALVAARAGLVCAVHDARLTRPVATLATIDDALERAGVARKPLAALIAERQKPPRTHKGRSA